jgi:hypothetical protein
MWFKVRDIRDKAYGFSLNLIPQALNLFSRGRVRL